MSHFPVAVFHKPNQRIDELLAPYDENLEVEAYVRYTRQEAIDTARQREYNKNKSDDECWAIMADGERTDEDGNILTTYNPQSKWDWWEVGGRWSGMLNLDGKPVNSGRVGDLDFTKGVKEAYDTHLRFWDVVVEHKPAKADEDYFSIYNESYYREYYGDRETYARHMSQFSTYAVVTPDGVWHGKGDMGWWGCSSESAEEAKSWEDHYKERFLDAADPDWILTIVDCHI